MCGSPEVTAVPQRSGHGGVLVLVCLEGAGEGIDARRVGGVHLDHPLECFRAAARLGYTRQQVIQLECLISPGEQCQQESGAVAEVQVHRLP